MQKQYVFIHDTLKLIIEKKIKEMQAHNDENIYQNTGGPEENVYANEAFRQSLPFLFIWPVSPCPLIPCLSRFLLCLCLSLPSLSAPGLSLIHI